jgi:hypothetical protein
LFFNWPFTTWKVPAGILYYHPQFKLPAVNFLFWRVSVICRLHNFWSPFKIPIYLVLYYPFPSVNNHTDPTTLLFVLADIWESVTYVWMQCLTWNCTRYSHNVRNVSDWARISVEMRTSIVSIFWNVTCTEKLMFN